MQQVVQGLDVSVERQPKGTEAANVSSTESKAYQALARSLRELQPGTVVAPGLLIGGTDAIHFTDLAETILRFRPIHVTAKDLARLHGTDEQIGVKEYREMIQFYERLLLNLNP